jgi:hypothetical protein
VNGVAGPIVSSGTILNELLKTSAEAVMEVGVIDKEA